MKSVELFAGAGGLAMGVTLAGFESVAVVERDRWACDTVRENRRRGFPLVADWPLWRGDVREFDWNVVAEGIDLVAGGPPCQPFSMGGKHRAHDDARDMFPTTIGVIRKLKPRAFIIENVKGLTRAKFADYLDYLLLHLRYPEVERRDSEDWAGHRERLSRVGRPDGLQYIVTPTLVDAADYGVPQRRERVFIVGFRADVPVNWAFPEPTHALDALLYSQWISGAYWDLHGVAKPAGGIPARYRKRVHELDALLLPPSRKPWRTVRDALQSLPEPGTRPAPGFLNHVRQEGAKPYPGHTGSSLDMPAKALKAGDHGVPGGENMMVTDNGDVRYFTVREAARIQTFPDGYAFHGSWSETMRQLGNAVPVALARVVAASVITALAQADLDRIARDRGRSVA